MLRKQWWFALSLGVSLLWLSGCGGAAGPVAVELQAADNGSAVEVAAGGSVKITLEGNPSTGYTWEAKDLDAALLEQGGEAAFVSDSPDLLGAGGKLTFTFKALKAGTTKLTLIYHRPWETDVEPVDTFSVNVTVK